VRFKERSGRRWVYQVDTKTGEVFWISWRLFERVSGRASSEEHARAAIEHFLEAKSTYSQAAR